MNEGTKRILLVLLAAYIMFPVLTVASYNFEESTRAGMDLEIYRMTHDGEGPPENKIIDHAVVAFVAATLAAAIGVYAAGPYGSTSIRGS
jgi:Zn-dependent membrane protease YugP